MDHNGNNTLVTLTKAELEAEIAASQDERRAKINQSNIKEFVQNGDGARTSAALLDRASQMKTAVIDNQDMALSRSTSFDAPSSVPPAFQNWHPAEERIRNLESHLGIIAVPCDRSLFSRLKILEDKILRIEQHYPQIAAHCFNYGQADFEASTKPGGRVSQMLAEETPSSGPKRKRKTAGRSDSLEDLRIRMNSLREKLLKPST